MLSFWNILQYKISGDRILKFGLFLSKNVWISNISVLHVCSDCHAHNLLRWYERGTQKCRLLEIPHAPTTLCAKRGADTCVKLLSMKLMAHQRNLPASSVQSIVPLQRWTSIYERDECYCMASDASSRHHPIMHLTGWMDCFCVQ